MPSVTLLFPNLLNCRSDDPDAFAGLRLPSLELLLSRGTHVAAQCGDDAVWLCRRFGVTAQDDWPVAALCLAGDGIQTGDNFWLRADPVHLEVQQKRLLLWPPDRLALTAEETDELAASLHDHFSAQNLVFVAPVAQRWYLGVQPSPDLRTVPLAAARGRDVNRLLPQGSDRMRWHRLFNETQMLLHHHPVNVAREARGLPAVNSLWFWGGGRLPQVSSPFNTVAASGALLRGLARAAGLTADAATGLLVPEHGRGLAELPPSASGDCSAMPGIAELHQHEQRWFAPALAALRTGRLESIELATIAGGLSHEWTLDRGGLRRFWRRAVPLSDHAQRFAAAPGE